MSADDDRRDRIAAPGSDLYYSLYRLDPSSRAAIVALYGLARAIDSAGRADDETIAAAKLHWWRQEFDRLFAAPARPEHPLCIALIEPIRFFALPRAPFDDLLAAADRDRRYDICPDFATLQSYCHLSGASLTLLCSRILASGPGSADAVHTGAAHAGERAHAHAHAHALGIALRLLDLLTDVRTHARRGRFYLPEDELARFHLDHRDLLSTRSTPALTALFAFQAQRIREFVARAQNPDPSLASAAPSDWYRADQRPLRILTRLRLAWLDAVEEDGFPLTRERTQLTPLRKLWLAWRTR